MKLLLLLLQLPDMAGFVGFWGEEVAVLV